MTAFDWKRVLRLAACAATVGLSATVVVAQNDTFESTPFGPPEELESNSGEAWESTVPRQGGNAIDAFQVRKSDTDDLAGRLRVRDPYSGELRPVRRSDLLIIQDGQVVTRAQTGVDGVAHIRGLQEGKYSVVVLGPDGMAAFGFEMLPEATGTQTPAYRFDTLLVPNADVNMAQRVIQESHSPAPLGPHPAPAVNINRPLPPIPASMGQGVIQPAGAVRSVPVEISQQYTVENVSAPLKGQPILVRDGETGVGQLVILDSASGEPVGLANANLSFIRAGQILGTVRTDDQGYCGVVGLEDGVYSMVGVGENGFVALGVRVETSTAAPAAEATASTDRALGDEFVSAMQYGPPPVGWRVAGAHPSAIGFAPGFACGGCGEVGCSGGCGVGPCGGACGPMAGYGFGGCGGFGGGFGGGGLGGGGLLGALVGAGLGAAIGAAVADDNGDDGDGDDDDGPGDDDDDDDDDDDPGPQPPNSPFLPPNRD